MSPAARRRPLGRLDRWLLPPLAAAGHRLAGTRRRRRGLAAVGLTAVVATLLAATWLGARGDGGTDGAGEALVQVGPTPGEPPGVYRARAAARLSALLAGAGADETYALVIFDRYLTPDRLTPVIGGVATSAVFVRAGDSGAYRLTAHRIPRDVTERMAELASHHTGEEAAAYATGCACVYAAVVRARPAVLAEIAERAEVWAVDPAVEAHRLDRVVFRPPVPSLLPSPRP